MGKADPNARPESETTEFDHKPESDHTRRDGSSSIDRKAIETSFYFVYTALCLCIFLVGLDANIIATAIPVITSRFNSISDVAWYGSAYYITLCATQPFAGKLYTIFSNKIVLLSYILAFEIGSIVCATARSSSALIVGRAIAGLGSSGVFAGGLIIVSTVVPIYQRALFIGLLNSMFSIASIVGPVIGGALTQHVSWRWCFYINLPPGGAAALVIILLLRSTETIKTSGSCREARHLDFPGFGLFAGSMTMLLLALQWGGNIYAWRSSTIIGLFIGSGIAAIIFLLWQKHCGDAALIPPGTFANRNVVLITFSAVFAVGPFQIIIYWMPIWFQAVLGKSPGASGVSYLPTVISDVLAAIIASAVVTKLGRWNPFLLLGNALLSVGAGLATTLHPNASSGQWIGFQILMGSGFSIGLALSFFGLQASLPKERVAIGNSVLLTCTSASCAVFLSIGQTTFQHQLLQKLTSVTSLDTALQVLSDGVTGVRSIVQPEESVRAIRAYSDSINDIFFIPTVSTVISFALILGCRWISTRREDVK